MDQRIFDMELSVEATSLYLLIVSLLDGGAAVNRDIVANLWNSGEDQLDQAMAELTRRGISGQGAGGDWFIRPASDWQPPETA